MVRNNLVSAVALLLLIACLSSCVPLVIPSEHDYVLIRSEGGDLTVVEDDAPLYERFYFVASRLPVPVAAVLAAARRREAGRETEVDGIVPELQLDPFEVRQRIVTLRKVP